MKRIVAFLALAGIALLVVTILNSPGKAHPMPKPVLQDSYAPIDDAKLAAAEARMGVRFPEDYRQFLLRTNGGEFPFEVCNADDGCDPRYICVREFYGVASGEYYDIEYWHRLSKPYLPPGYIPIAADSGGDDILIVTTGADVGAICARDHEVVEPENMRVVARSFAEFYDSLLFDQIIRGTWQETIPQFAAAERGDLDRLVELLDGGFDIETRNANGSTLLGVAAWNRQAHVVRELLSRDADVDARNMSQQTPLHLAAQGHSIDGARLLLDAGADIDAVDDIGNTPLLIAMSSSSRLAKEFIRRDANVNCRNNEGQTPLRSCADLGDVELRDLLINNGARK